MLLGKVNGRANRPKADSYRAKFTAMFGKDLEEFASVRRAFEGLRKETLRGTRGSLANFFLYLNENPDVVIANRMKDVQSVDATVNERYERAVRAYVKKLTDEGLAGFTIRARVSRVQGFFKNNGRKLKLELDRLRISKSPKIHKHTVTNEEVRKVLGVADCARDKLIVSVMYQNGPAPVDVADLVVGDYPETPWTFFITSRSKSGEVWRGVSTPDTCEALKAYLPIRNGRKGEPLFVGRRGALDNMGISEIVSGLIAKAGFGDVEGFRPYSLRDAFEDALGDAEVYHKVKEALMGHSSDIEQRYGGRKKAEENCVLGMRKAYPLLCLHDYHLKSAEESRDVKELWGYVKSLEAKIKEIEKWENFIHRLDEKK